MTLEPVVAAKVWFIAAWFIAFFVMERLTPAKPAPAGFRRLISNSGMWVLVLAVSPLIVLPLTAFAGERPLWTRPAQWSGVPALIVDLVVFDLWAYWVHRAYHEIPLMRRLHLPHHLDEHLDSTSAMRFHIFEIALSAGLRMIPIVLLAVPFAHVVLFETLLLAASIFHHSNIRLPERLERGLSRIVVTPSIHWVHHHAVRRDTNSNYAAILSLWDPLFRTRSATQRTPDMKIGLEGLGDRPLLRLLLAPFSEPGR